MVVGDLEYDENQNKFKEVRNIEFQQTHLLRNSNPSSFTSNMTGSEITKKTVELRNDMPTRKITFEKITKHKDTINKKRQNQNKIDTGTMKSSLKTSKNVNQLTSVEDRFRNNDPNSFGKKGKSVRQFLDDKAAIEPPIEYPDYTEEQLQDSVIMRYEQNRRNTRDMFVELYGDAIKELEEEERRKKMNIFSSQDQLDADNMDKVNDDFFFKAMRIVEKDRNRHMLLKRQHRTAKVMNCAIDEMLQIPEEANLEKLDFLNKQLDEQMRLNHLRHKVKEAEIALAEPEYIPNYLEHKKMTESQMYWKEYDEIESMNKKLLGSFITQSNITN